jgi:hypothetical protein
VTYATDFVVYGVYKSVDLGGTTEPAQKDFYVNMGSNHGLRNGATLEVLRKTATYDVANQKLYKDLTFPIARLKVIHAEANAAIARLEKMLPNDSTPAITPRTVMVGDIVQPVK